MFIIEELVHGKWVPMRTTSGKLYQYTDEITARNMIAGHPALRIVGKPDAR